MKNRIIFTGVLIVLLVLINYTSFSQKPNVWIYTDMSDQTIPGINRYMGRVNDPDDISAMAGYLLMSNEFNTLGIVVSSTHRSEHATTPDQGIWANEYFGEAYQKDLPALNEHIGGYPPEHHFTQSSIKETSERFDTGKDYKDLDKYPTVEALLQTILKTDEMINVLCWGPLTEPAILVKHCLAKGKEDALKNIRFIAHWTNSPLYQGTPEHPENVSNCREDAKACAYLKDRALERKIDYYECGAIGQHGIVSGSQTGWDYFNQFKVSALGTIFVEGKYTRNGRVDHSDAATYWVLLGNWGVSLDDIRPDGINTMAIEKANKEKFEAWSNRIHDELLRRAKLITKD